LEAAKPRRPQDIVTPSGSALLGQVSQVMPDSDHGFILNNVGSQVYFHRDSVTSGDFASLKPGDSVHYVEEEGAAGPVATKVRIARA
jgi:cold shock CspA family protein